MIAGEGVRGLSREIVDERLDMLLRIISIAGARPNLREEHIILAIGLEHTASNHHLLC